MTTCITATDTFSVDGKVVLLERGTKLVGETQSEVQQGSSRVFYFGPKRVHRRESLFRSPPREPTHLADQVCPAKLIGTSGTGSARRF